MAAEIDKISSPEDWDPVFDRFSLLPPEAQNSVGRRYNTIDLKMWNHERLAQAIDEWEAKNFLAGSKEAALEYEEAMAAQDLLGL